ncbi:MAG: hypothetical protein IKZ81_07900 [Clostridia bacterium]|nr:hypothetical protein [Clostridia bacterium]MBR5943244.1 hypothetical protein [Clostridia bacterium]
MKYENAKDILPKELFEQVQKYASGKLLYFPISGQRCLWGSKNGNRYRIEKRNEEIRRLYENGYTHDQLSELFYLTPESIKNIIYSKKGTKMNLDEILRLYSDDQPCATELINKIDEMTSWGEYYYLADYAVDFSDKKLIIRIHQYPFTTPARIEEQNQTAEAYINAGCDVCRIVPNRLGELSRSASFEGHNCVIFAEEYRENAIPASEASQKCDDGRYVYTDELLSLMARIGNKHLNAKEPNYAVLFDNSSSCFGQYEDWIHEYTEDELPNMIKDNQPDLIGLYDKINAELRRTRELLRPMYEKLPKSVFHGEEKSESILLDQSGHLVSLCGFMDGGADVCANHFLCVAMQADEMLPDDYAWLAVHDPEIHRLRVQSIVHSMQVVGKEYTWDEKELIALPLIYKLLLFGRSYYYGSLFGLMKDHDKLKEMLEYILDQVTSPDEINFREILSE